MCTSHSALMSWKAEAQGGWQRREDHALVTVLCRALLARGVPWRERREEARERAVMGVRGQRG